MRGMDLFLRRVHHPQARNNYRVVVKLDDGEIEVGSIGIQTTNTGSMWVWGLDAAVPIKIRSEGTGKGVGQCMRRFRVAWDQFAANEINLRAFLKTKRAARR